MQTYTEITEAEVAKRQAAHRYESLKNDEISLTARIKRLDFAPVNTKALEQILELCDQVPQGIVTSGRQQGFATVPGGMVVRDLLKVIGGNALIVAQRKETERSTELKTTRESLARVVKTLKEEFPS